MIEHTDKEQIEKVGYLKTDMPYNELAKEIKELREEIRMLKLSIGVLQNEIEDMRDDAWEQNEAGTVE